MMNEYPIPYHTTWDIVDPSKMNDFLECPRKYFFMHMLGWRPESPNNHLIFGQAWHKAMEHLLLRGFGPESIVDAGEELREHYRRNFPEETDELFSPKTPDRAVLALTEYTVKWKRTLEDFEVLYTEVSSTVPISETMIMHFRMDNILRHKQDGYYCSLEHKTGTYLNNQWMMQWPLSVQVGCYMHALYCMFPPEQVRGIIVDGAFFKRTKAALFDFERVPIWKTPTQMRIWHSTVDYYLSQIKTEAQLLQNESPDAPTMLSFPQRPTSCNNYFGCAFHDFCTAWPNPIGKCEEPPLGFKVEFWNPQSEDSRHSMEFKSLNVIEEGK